MNQQQLSTIKACLIGSFILSYLLKAVFSLTFLSEFMAILVIAVLLISFRQLKPLNRGLLILLLLGSGALIWLGNEEFNWTAASIENAGIVTLLLTVPLLGAILYFAPYESVILAFASRYIQSGYAFYVVTLALVSFLASFMSLAAAPFAYQLLRPIAAQYPDITLHRGLMRGFGVNLFWAPNLISVAVVLKYVAISWLELARVGLCFSLLSFLAACLLGKVEHMRAEQSTGWQTECAAKPSFVALRPEHRTQMLSLLGQVFTILAAVLVMTNYFKQTIFVSVAVVSMTIPLLIACVLGKLPVYQQRLKYYFFQVLPGMSNEFILFLAIGFFGYTLNRVLSLATLQDQMAALSGLAPAVLSLLVIGVIAGLAIGGIHPIITISSLAIALSQLALGLTAIQLAITLITGYVGYLLLSPFSSLAMLMAAITGKNVYQIGIKLNWQYAALLALLVTISIQVWPS